MTETKDHFSIGEVAQATGLTHRALRYYDAIGLVQPSLRQANGYRCYRRNDLLRLHEVCLYRDLGLSLNEIAEIIANDGQRTLRLSEQLSRLREKHARQANQIRAVEAALEASKKEQTSMQIHDMFNGFDPADHEDEARERWGQSDAWAESQRRTKGYSEQDWKDIKEEWRQIYASLFALLEAGAAPQSPAVQEQVEAHRLLIDRRFYPCPVETHLGLADLYESDPRFAKNINKHGEGLAIFLVAGIRASAAA